MLESSAARPCRAHLSLGWDEGDLRIAMGVVCLTHLTVAFSETHGLVRPGSLVTQVVPETHWTNCWLGYVPWDELSNPVFVKRYGEILATFDPPPIHIETYDANTNTMIIREVKTGRSA